VARFGINGWGIPMVLLELAGQHWLTKLWETVSASLYHFGGLGVMLLAIGDSSFLSVPEGNDLLIVLLSAGKPWTTMAYYVAMTTLGSVIGCILLYSVGRKGGSPILKRRFSEQKIARAEKLFERHGLLTVLIPSVLPPPLPFKIFVLSAGVFRLNLFSFLTAVAVGRSLRYSIWGILAVLYGNPVKTFIQENLKVVGILFFAVFILITAIVVFYFIRHPKEANIEKTN
jgi:membrane protein DedA with SNARE-associated domain